MSVRVDVFPLADRRILAAMRHLRALLTDHTRPYRGPLSQAGLRSVTFLASTAGDLVVNLTYKPDYGDSYWAARWMEAPAAAPEAGAERAVLDDQWRSLAKCLHDELSSQMLGDAAAGCRCVSLIGRAKREKVSLTDAQP